MSKVSQELWIAVDAIVSPSLDATRCIEAMVHVLGGDGTKRGFSPESDYERAATVVLVQRPHCKPALF